MKIITGWSDSGEPISEEKILYGDPYLAYRNETGAWIDADEDGIPDVVEVWFSNSSIVTNLTYRQEFIDRFGLSLYNQYKWTVDYFNTVKSQENESAAEQWLSDQFNPFVVENMPPMVVKFTVKFYYLLFTAYVEYHVEVRDAGLITSVELWNLDSMEMKRFEPYSGHLEFSGSFFASPWGANLGFNLKLYAHDVAGNSFSTEKQVKGPVGQIIDALVALWNAIMDALAKAAEAVAKGVNAIVEWAQGIIENMLKPLIEPLFSAAEDWVAKIGQILGILISGQSSTQNVYGIRAEIKANGEGVITQEEAITMLYMVLFETTIALVITAIAALILYVLEPLLWILVNVLPAGVAFNVILSMWGSAFEMTLKGLAMDLIGKIIMFSVFTISLSLIGGIIAAIVPEDDPTWQAVTSAGFGILDLIAFVLVLKLLHQPLDKLSMGDKIGLILALLGFLITVFSYAASAYQYVLNVIGVILTVIGLIIAILSTPDLPGVVGFLDEGLDAILMGFAIVSTWG